MEEAEEAEEAAMRAAALANQGEGEGDDDQVMTGMMSAATLGGEVLVGVEVLGEAPEEELEDSIMTATNTPTPADTIQPN